MLIFQLCSHIRQVTYNIIPITGPAQLGLRSFRYIEGYDQHEKNIN